MQICSVVNIAFSIYVRNLHSVIIDKQRCDIPELTSELTRLLHAQAVSQRKLVIVQEQELMMQVQELLVLLAACASCIAAHAGCP